MNKKLLEDRIKAVRSNLYLNGLLSTIKNEASGLLFLKATKQLGDNLQEELDALLSSYAMLEKTVGDLNYSLSEIEIKLRLETHEECEND